MLILFKKCAVIRSGMRMSTSPSYISKTRLGPTRIILITMLTDKRRETLMLESNLYKQQIGLDQVHTALK